MLVVCILEYMIILRINEDAVKIIMLIKKIMVKNLRQRGHLFWMKI